MATRKPFVNVNGELRELPSGDLVDGVGIITDYGLVTELASTPVSPTSTIASNLQVVNTWAQMPNPATVTAYVDRVFCIGVGVGGSEWYSDGTRWRAVGGQVVLRRTNIPIGLPSNGTIGANGALTLNVAMPLTLDGGAYFYFPANAITGSNAAGFYYVVMSSTTSGTVYNNTFDPALNTSPAIPALPTVFSGTTGQAYTQTTSVINVLQTTIPAGVISTNAEILHNVEFAYNLGAANKQFSTYANGVYITGSSRTTIGGHDSFTIRYKFLSNTKISIYGSSESGTASSATHLINTISDTQSNQFVIARRLTTSSGAADNAIYLGLTEYLCLGE